MRTRAVLTIALASALACAPAPSEGEGEGEGEGDEGEGDEGEGEGEGEGEPVESFAILDDESDIAAVRGANGFAKFLFPVDGAAETPPILDCVFQNTTLYPFHLEYLHEQESTAEMSYDEYIAAVIARATRVWWGGEVAWFESIEHPLTGEPGTLVYGLYTQDNVSDRLQLDDVRAVFAILNECAPFYADRLAFVPQGTEQRTTAQAGEATLAGEGIAIVFE